MYVCIYIYIKSKNIMNKILKIKIVKTELLYTNENIELLTHNS